MPAERLPQRVENNLLSVIADAIIQSQFFDGPAEDTGNTVLLAATRVFCSGSGGENQTRIFARKRPPFLKRCLYGFGDIGVTRSPFAVSNVDGSGV